MKTPVTVLQEMMIKLCKIPEYECIAQSGPQHQASFEYQCSVLGVVVTATARSKKEAKQEAARLMLQQLAARGHAVPPPYGLLDHHQPQAILEGGTGAASGAGAGAAASTGAGAGAGPGPVVTPHSYVALLQELCTEYRLAGPEYELVADTGPPHLRRFTMAASVARARRTATASTKKAARQQAAEALYTYLRENLARLTTDFVEEEALVRAHERAMERYSELRDDTRRPDLGQKIVDYHLGLTYRLEAESRAAALRCLQQEEPAEALAAALQALGLRAEAGALAGDSDSGSGCVHVLSLPGASPPLMFAGPSAASAAADAARYLRRALARPQAHASQPPGAAAATTAAPSVPSSSPFCTY